MKFKLFKVPFVYVGTDKKEHTAYNYYLCTETGSIMRCNPHRYKDDNDVWHDNTNSFYLLAIKVSSYEEIKYE